MAVTDTIGTVIIEDSGGLIDVDGGCVLEGEYVDVVDVVGGVVVDVGVVLGR